MMTVSVIVPIYNGEKYIESCVSSLNRQTIEGLEIIFVDDGSTDCSLSLLKRFESVHTKVLVQENAGAGVARNTGIKHATGEFIAFLDVDDTFAEPNTLQKLYDRAKENHALICGGSMQSIDRQFDRQDKRVFNSEGFVEYAQYQFDFGFSRFIYSRQFLLEHGILFPTYRIYEDPVFMASAMIAAKRFYAIPDVVYNYSGAHQLGLNVEKVVDYLHGLRDNLLLSSKHGYPLLHEVNFKRLETTASFYAERNLAEQNVLLFKALIDANSAIDTKLLHSAHIDISDDYIIPALHIVWRACNHYLKLRSFLSVKNLFKRRD